MRVSEICLQSYEISERKGNNSEKIYLIYGFMRNSSAI